MAHSPLEQAKKGVARIKLAKIANTILNETSTPDQLSAALLDFSALCSHAGGVKPDRSFDAWAEDSFLGSGVAINSQAAAHCVTDFQRTVVFIRGIHAALTAAMENSPGVPIKVLYAGCGPYATLMLPLLPLFNPGQLDITLLDYHQQSLDSVTDLIGFFAYQDYQINLQRADACHYQHSEPLHLIVAEVMQKALEQEPQFAVTANLAPQLRADGVFIPQKIDIALCLGNLEQERAAFQRDGVIDEKFLLQSGSRVSLGTVFTLLPEQAAGMAKSATMNQVTGALELMSTQIEIPSLLNTDGFDVILMTRIQVFSHHKLTDYEAQITLPLRCSGLTAIREGEKITVSYELGPYPKFNVFYPGTVYPLTF
ncbi:MAG: hypothetical protein AB8B86_19570 [Pseudomonadales bacterium]